MTGWIYVQYLRYVLSVFQEVEIGGSLGFSFE